MSDLPPCPKCACPYTYLGREILTCPEYTHEWTEAEASLVRDPNGNVLQDGDTVTLIKNLKVKGAGVTINVGTKVRNIRLVDGVGQMGLKSEFVRKVT